MRSVCVVELRDTVSYITVLSVAHSSDCGKFMLPATMQILRTVCALHSTQYTRHTGTCCHTTA